MTGAALRRLPGGTAAVFSRGPEQALYNNALLDRGLAAAARRAAVDAMQAAYAEAGVVHFAAWVHESDGAMRAELDARGYTVAETAAVGFRDLGRILEYAPPGEKG